MENTEALLQELTNKEVFLAFYEDIQTWSDDDLIKAQETFRKESIRLQELYLQAHQISTMMYSLWRYRQINASNV